MNKIDKALSLRMAILNLKANQTRAAIDTHIDGRTVANSIGYKLRQSGYTPYDVAQMANKKVRISDNAFFAIMKACNCSLYCYK